MHNDNYLAFDCAVIGGGPAGLTAAVYLARYHLRVIVFDDRTSRVATIPLSHNVPGFPDGIRGENLLSRMRDHAVSYGARMTNVTVATLSKSDRGFLVSSADRQVEARVVLMATGVKDRRPRMPAALHDVAVRDGKLRYCPVCDGYEVTDRKIAVIGSGSHSYSEAVFLRSFTQDLSLVSHDTDLDLSQSELTILDKLGVQLVLGPVTTISLVAGSIRMTTAAGDFDYEVAYPALGCDTRSGLAAPLGVDLSPDGCIEVDKHQRSSVPGLYAAGDAVVGLNQISNAMGQAAVAATAIRNDLSQKSMMCR